MQRGRASSRSRGQTPSSRGTSTRGRGRGGATSSPRKSESLHDVPSGSNLPLTRGRDLKRGRSRSPSFSSIRTRRGCSLRGNYGNHASGMELMDFVYDIPRSPGSQRARIQRAGTNRALYESHASGMDFKQSRDGDGDAVPNSICQRDDNIEDSLLRRKTDTPTSAAPTTTSLEADRHEHAAKREQEEQRRRGNTPRGGRGSNRGSFQDKTVRFTSPPIQPKMANRNPFSTTSATTSSSTENANSTALSNPFAAPSNPFGASSLSTTTSSGRNPFAPSPSNGSTSTNPFGTTQAESQSIFGAPPTVKPAIQTSVFGNPFGSPSTATGTQTASIFGAPTGVKSTATINPFQVSESSSPLSNLSNLPNAPGNFFQPKQPSLSAQSPKPSPFATQTSPKAAFSAATLTSTPPIANGASQKPKINFSKPKTAPNSFSQPTSKAPSNSSAVAIPNKKSKLAIDIDNILRQKGIVAPTWPTPTPGDPQQKAAVEAFWHTTKAYRAKVRTCLMRNGFLDDPDKPKKLSEAIDFKGTCEEMCPEFEKITRIMEHDVQGPEKELQPDGHSLWPSLPKMIKALARSAAGQDAPLPEDVRSPAALRRTLDYLIDDVLADNSLESVHGFLWNRTRAIRRDFVFQQASMSSQELVDQVYCLEVITRFHVIALHQMSEEGTTAEDFSEQQEVEQLGKALLSLIHAYEDCAAQNVPCENESEFRAYYVIFNSQNTGILEAVQDWGYDVWKGSQDIQTAVTLVETLQNIWDATGPLRPHSSTSIAQNAFRRFFVILENSKVSYTMACFAEIHFNSVRKAALKTILAAYRKQRDQTKDWTLARLNEYLFFDDEDDIIPFGEAYGLNFESYSNEDCLAFESDDSMTDPFPKLKQSHSKKVVERKRGNHTLPEVIYRTVYEDPSQVLDENDSMFVPLQESEADTAKSAPNVKPVGSVEGQTNGRSSLGWPSAESSARIGPANSMDQRQLPQNQPFLSPFKSASSAKVATSTFFPPKEAVTGITNSPGAVPQYQNSTTTESGVFSFLGQTQTSPPTTNKPPGPSLFGSKEGTKDKSATEAHPTTPGLFQSPEVIASPSLGSGQVGTDLSPSMKNAGGPSKTHSPITSQFNFPSQSHQAQTAPSLFPYGTATGSSIAPIGLSSPSPFTSTAQTDSQSPAIKTTPAENGPAKTPEVARLPPKPAVVAPPSKPLGSFPEWVMLCKRGLIEQFTEVTVQKILADTIGQFLAEEMERKDKIDRDTADEFRRRSLAMKYGDLWRKNAHLTWLRRRGRQARQLRREMAEEAHRKTIAAQKQSVAEDFKTAQQASQKKATEMLRVSQQKSAEKLLSKSGMLNGGHNPKDIVRSVARGHHRSSSGVSSPKTPIHKQSRDGSSPKSSKDRRFLSQEERLAIMREGLTLPGGSFITRMPQWSPEDEDKLKQRSKGPRGVQTDYFRLKARGIYTLPDGSPLAATAAVNLDLLTGKKPYDESHDTTPDVERASPYASVPSIVMSSVRNRPRPPPSVDPKSDEAAAIIARAREIMAQDKEQKDLAKKKKRVYDDSETEELLASCKRIREQMDEGAAWYREEIRKSISRSTSR